MQQHFILLSKLLKSLSVMDIFKSALVRIMTANYAYKH